MQTWPAVGMAVVVPDVIRRAMLAILHGRSCRSQRVRSPRPDAGGCIPGLYQRITLQFGNAF